MWAPAAAVGLTTVSMLCNAELELNNCTVGLWAQYARQPWLLVTKPSVLSTKAVEPGPACDPRPPLLCTQPVQTHLYLS